MPAGLERELGGDIPAAVRATITVKVVAAGEGNPEPGAGGACCTAFSLEAFYAEFEEWRQSQLGS